MPRLLVMLLLPAAFLLSWLAIGSPSPRADFVVACDPIRTIDPHRVSFADEIAISGTLFEGLTRLNEQTFLPQPAVAERWEISPDGLRYTFHLRPAARWSNGAPLLAEHFRSAWLRALDPAYEAQYASTLFIIEGAEALYRAATEHESRGDMLTDDSGFGVRVIDDHTLEVRLAAPCPYFLELLSFPVFAPTYTPLIERFAYRDGLVLRATRHLWLRPEHLVCNGPFVLRAWDFKERFLVTRNPAYWDRAAIGVATIEFYLAPNANAALVAYETQRVDMVRGLDTEVALELERARTAGLRGDFHVGERFATFFLRLNCRRPPLDDPNVRRALALAVDRELIATHVLGLGERAAYGYVPWHVFTQAQAALGDARQPHVDVGLGAGLPREQRLALARQCLEASGFDRLAAARPLELAYTAEPAQFRRVCEAVQAMWERDLGLAVEPRALESRVLSQRIRQLDYDIVRSNWFGDFLDPATFLEMFTSDSPQNRTGWSCERYDALIAAAAREPDAVQRLELLKAAERILCEEELPIIPLYFMRGNYLLNPRFELTDSPRGVPLFHRVRPAGGTGSPPANNGGPGTP